MMRWLFVLTAALAVLVMPAGAEEYWIAYEGNDFPENEGWTRVYGDGGWPPEDEPDRWIENGELVIDTSRDSQLWEYYWLPLFDPGPGETFVAEWRVRSEILSGQYDNSVVFARDASPGHVAFRLGTGVLFVATENLSLPITPAESHVYRFESADMQAYTLCIDGEPVHEGHFETDTFLQSYTGFSADAQGTRSVSYWDYYRFGVVPEPNPLASVIACGLLFGCSVNKERRSIP